MDNIISFSSEHRADETMPILNDMLKRESDYAHSMDGFIRIFRFVR